MLVCLCPIGVLFSNNSKPHFSARLQEGLFAQSILNISLQTTKPRNSDTKATGDLAFLNYLSICISIPDLNSTTKWSSYDIQGL